MNWNSTEFVWLDWAVLAIGVIGVIWAVWHAIVKDRKAQKGEDSSAYLFGKGEPWYVIGMAIFAANIGSEHLVGLAGIFEEDTTCKGCNTHLSKDVSYEGDDRKP